MKLFGILLFALGFSQCAGMKMDQNPPFAIKHASYSHITGGLPGNSSLNLMIEYTSDNTVYFDKVYFQNRIVNAVTEVKSGKQYIAARYKTSTQKSKYETVLHSDPKEEYGNTPKTEEAFPFNLKKNEAIISYKIGNNMHYYKVKNIQKEKRIFMQ